MFQPLMKTDIAIARKFKVSSGSNIRFDDLEVAKLFQSTTDLGK